jgi:hypothetical protein
MRADVFQAVALCCHANAYLKGLIERPPELIANSTFKPVHEIVFERMGNGMLAGGTLADSPGPWLRRMSKESVAHLALSFAGCPFDPQAATKESWGIVTDGDTGVEIWQPTWKKRIRSHGDTSPWRVSYLGLRTNRWQVKAAFSLEDATKLLDSALRNAADAHPLIARLRHPGRTAFVDLYPPDWPKEQRELGDLAVRAAALLRSEEWSQLSAKQEMSTTDHDAVSQKLWRAALMALEASAVMGATSAHPTVHSSQLAS